MKVVKSWDCEEGNKQKSINFWLKYTIQKFRQQRRTLNVFISPLCLTCIERIIEIKRLREVFSALGIKVIFYCEGSKKEARTIKTDFHLPFKVISIDRKSQKWISSNVSVTPFYSLLSKKGEILYSGRFSENWVNTKSILLDEGKKILK